MILESITVGRPGTHLWKGERVTTSIFKTPVTGPVMVRRHNVEGDRQSNTRVHGGEYKAVYAYAAEHYDWWTAELDRDLEPGSFGENLTIRGFDEPAVCIGDVFRVGAAELEAAAPRLPCSKLALRLGDPTMVKRFADAGRWGVYLKVRREGVIEVGDSVVPVSAHPERLPVCEIARVHLFHRDDLETAQRLARHDRLDPEWRRWFRELVDGVRE